MTSKEIITRECVKFAWFTASALLKANDPYKFNDSKTRVDDHKKYCKQSNCLKCECIDDEVRLWNNVGSYIKK